MKEEYFDFGTILSITTGRLLAPNGFSDVNDLINFLMDDDVTETGCVFVSDKIKAEVLRQHPFLKDISTYGLNKDNWQTWINDVGKIYGCQKLALRLED